MAGWTVNDLEPPLKGIAKDRNTNIAVDLSAATTVTANIERSDGSVISRGVTKDNQVTNKGGWSLIWVVGDLIIHGEYSAELVALWPEDRPQTFGPAKFPVNKEIA